MPDNAIRISTPINYEPKRKNRFQLDFPTELGIESWLVETSGRPKIEIQTIDVNEINTKNFVAGKVTYGTIQIKFKDHIGASTSQKIMEWIRLHYEGYTGRMGYAAGYKKDLYLKSLDPVGVDVERWILSECLITDASFDDNDLSSAELLMPTITVQPRFAELLY